MQRCGKKIHSNYSICAWTQVLRGNTKRAVQAFLCSFLNTKLMLDNRCFLIMFIKLTTFVFLLLFPPPSQENVNQSGAGKIPTVRARNGTQVDVVLMLNLLLIQIRQNIQTAFIEFRSFYYYHCMQKCFFNMLMIKVGLLTGQSSLLRGPGPTGAQNSGLTAYWLSFWYYKHNSMFNYIVPIERVQEIASILVLIFNGLYQTYKTQLCESVSFSIIYCNDQWCYIMVIVN